jgi:hypothetical protein
MEVRQLLEEFLLLIGIRQQRILDGSEVIMVFCRKNQISGWLIGDKRIERISLVGKLVGEIAKREKNRGELP